jgi:ABC-type antimicrobial peptide transport system permease subunit
VGRGLGLAAVGIAIGAAAAWGVTRSMSRLLYGVGSTDPATFTSTVALLCAVSFIACVIPAGRASRVDPMTVLRDQ